MALDILPLGLMEFLVCSGQNLYEIEKMKNVYLFKSGISEIDLLILRDKGLILAESKLCVILKGDRRRIPKHLRPLLVTQQPIMLLD